MYSWTSAMLAERSRLSVWPLMVAGVDGTACHVHSTMRLHIGALCAMAAAAAALARRPPPSEGFLARGALGLDGHVGAWVHFNDDR